MINWKFLASRIPSRVKLSKGRDYEVVFSAEISGDDTVLGETRHGEDIRQIVLKEGQTPKELVKTFLHELIHAISYDYDVGLSEKQVQKLEKATHYIVKLIMEFR